MKKLLQLFLCMVLACGLIPAQGLGTKKVEAATNFSVHYIEVGQGDGALLQYGSGSSAKYALIDAGPQTYKQSNGKTVDVSRRVLNYLNARKIKKLEFIMISHPHADHIGGFVKILEDTSIQVGKVYAPVSLSDMEGATKSDFLEIQGNEYAPKTMKKVAKLIKDRGIPVVVPYFKQSVYFGGAKITFYSPAKNSYTYGRAVDLGTRQINKCSIVCRIIYGKNSFLMTGDVQKEAVQAMVARGAYLKSQVLKEPHHGFQDVLEKNKKGDYNSDHKYLIDKTQPSTTIISNGYKNGGGVPFPRVLRDLAKSDVYTTSNKGTIVVTSNGSKISIGTQRGGKSPTYKKCGAPYKTKIKANVKGIKTLNVKTKTKSIKSYRKKVKLSFQAEYGRAGMKKVQYKVVPKGKSSKKYRWKTASSLTYKKKTAVTVYVKFYNRIGKTTTKKTNKFKIK